MRFVIILIGLLIMVLLFMDELFQRLGIPISIMPISDNTVNWNAYPRGGYAWAGNVKWDEFTVEDGKVKAKGQAIWSG